MGLGVLVEVEVGRGVGIGLQAAMMLKAKRIPTDVVNGAIRFRLIVVYDPLELCEALIRNERALCGLG